jgi:hypothetical protein
LGTYLLLVIYSIKNFASFFGGIGVWSQSFVLARQVLHPVSHPFLSGYFGDKNLSFFLLWPDWTVSILFTLPVLDGMRGAYQHAYLLSLTCGGASHDLLCSDWPGTLILLISASQIGLQVWIMHQAPITSFKQLPSLFFSNKYIAVFYYLN